MDLAASVQAVLEEVVLRLTRSIADMGVPNLCLAGGVALNCVANGKVQKDGRFRNIWIQPAAGDAGGALGAALAAHHIQLNQPRAQSSGRDCMKGSYLGPTFEQGEIERRLQAAGAAFEVLSDQDFIVTCAKDLAAGKAVGWFQGRMEFGPRALGGRSILADARSLAMQSVLNLKVKFARIFPAFCAIGPGRGLVGLVRAGL